MRVTRRQPLCTQLWQSIQRVGGLLLQAGGLSYRSPGFYGTIVPLLSHPAGLAVFHSCSPASRFVSRNLLRIDLQVWIHIVYISLLIQSTLSLVYFGYWNPGSATFAKMLKRRNSQGQKITRLIQDSMPIAFYSPVQMTVTCLKISILTSTDIQEYIVFWTKIYKSTDNFFFKHYATHSICITVHFTHLYLNPYTAIFF